MARKLALAILLHFFGTSALCYAGGGMVGSGGMMSGASMAPAPIPANPLDLCHFNNLADTISKENNTNESPLFNKIKTYEGLILRIQERAHQSHCELGGEILSKPFLLSPRGSDPAFTSSDRNLLASISSYIIWAPSAIFW